jgi:hypothetical protein
LAQGRNQRISMLAADFIILVAMALIETRLFQMVSPGD